MNPIITKLGTKISDLKNQMIWKTVNWFLQFAPKPKFTETAWAVASYQIFCYHPLPNGQPDFSRPIPEMTSPEMPNLVVDGGRQQVIKFILNILTTPLVAGFTYMGVGSVSTAANHADTALGMELIGNANRLGLLNSSNAALSDSDIVADSSVSPYFWKCIAQATYPSGDGNNTSVFNEFGLFSLNVFGTGEMYNRFVNPSPFTKSAAITCVAQLILRA